MCSEADSWGWFSGAGDGCYVVNDRCQIVLWNRAAQRLLGFNRGETLQRYCYDVIRGRGEDGQPFCQPKCAIWEGAARDTSVPSYYLLAQRKDGEALWVNMSLLLIPALPAKVNYIVHLFQDASQEKQALALTQRVLSFIERRTGSIPNLWDPPSPDPIPLSKRELEILKLMVWGGDTRAIARQVSISPYTVRNHLLNISRKLGLHNRLELLIYAFKNHLI